MTQGEPGQGPKTPHQSVIPPAIPIPRQRLGIGELMLLIAGLAVGLWVTGLGQKPAPDFGPAGEAIFLIVIGTLAGLSLVGPPLLLLRRRKGRWRPGQILWFATGTATWLLWPPVVYKRVVQGRGMGESTSGVCYVYGTPLMALYLTLALLAGGWLRRGRRRRRRSWHETFGLLLGLAWACTGLYVLYLLYSEDFKR